MKFGRIKRKVPAKKVFTAAILILFILGIIIFLQIVSPAEIVEKIGVRNGYLILFFVSLFGGFSAGGSVTFISLLATLAAGGLNPLYLSIVSGISLSIGDTIMFYAGSKGRELITGKWDKRINSFANTLERKPWTRRLVPVGAYLYIGLSPFPNDLLILSLAAIEYPLKRMISIIILGDITFTFAVAYLATQTTL